MTWDHSEMTREDLEMTLMIQDDPEMTFDEQDLTQDDLGKTQR